ncbi:MAG: hypothetical protein QM601_07470 [Pseudoxanthomonas sp.]
MAARPRIFVLAGVNGAGKSSVGGDALTQAGSTWFNPDDFARALIRQHGHSQEQANGMAWREGLRRLESAIANGRDFAFETTLGGNTIPARLRAAAASHDVMMWFCGLDSPERHMARVRLRVANGGHDIPVAKIRARYLTSRENLVALMPRLARLRVLDNSADAEPGRPVAAPRLLLQMEAGKIVFPTDVETLQRTPDWAKPILGAALSMAQDRT